MSNVRFWPAAVPVGTKLPGGASPVTIDVPSGTTLLESARLAGILVESPCNGSGTCGKCRVRVSSASLPHITLPAAESCDSGDSANDPEILLACHAQVAGSGDIDLQPLDRQDKKALQILSHGQKLTVALAPVISKAYDPVALVTSICDKDRVLGSEPGDTTAHHYGVVVDIGTTTLVAALIDLKSGQEMASASALNPQSLHAQDVLSRIRFAAEENGLDTLYRDIIDAINTLIAQITQESGVKLSHIYEIVFSGNTCMLHLATGADPASLGKYPYTPLIRGGNVLPARQLGLTAAAFAEVYLPPIISAYVGADITAGILAADLSRLDGTTLFVDIGTNGEMALAVDGQLTVTSTAAGPAFEGMNITHGMRAAPGALEKFQISADGDLEIQTIGHEPATGICGSGLLDIVGELVRCGLVLKNGKLADRLTTTPALADKLVTQAGKPAFAVTDQVFLSQKDIRQVQLAKGAVRAGIECLLDAKELSAADVDRVFIAGSFGYHLNPASLVHTGLLPEAFRDKIQFLGNTAKTGGEALLLNRTARHELSQLVQDVEVLELANVDNFDRTFVNCLSF
ncbi:MAG TPA: ASKHA domain-containing protein [Patescibacteria group bacterium]|nr:ASKHA domain-containing protein [Patescibacteria group bacterium]